MEQDGNSSLRRQISPSSAGIWTPPLVELLLPSSTPENLRAWPQNVGTREALARTLGWLSQVVHSRESSPKWCDKVLSLGWESAVTMVRDAATCAAELRTIDSEASVYEVLTQWVPRLNSLQVGR